MDPSGLQFRRPCDHSQKSKFNCKSVSIRDIIQQREFLHKNKSKVEQDKFLTRFIAPYRPQEHRQSTSEKRKPRKFSCTYFVLRKKKPTCVCKQFFQATFLIKSRRLNTIGKTLYDGNTPRENRGGDRKAAKHNGKREKVVKFLKSLHAKESHYNRQKSVRCYLSSDLSIAKLRKIYNNSVDAAFQAKKTFFWKIFNSLNIGFSTPASDVCATCFMLKHKVKTEKDESKKQEYRTKYRVHTLRANTFYKLLKKDVPRSLTLCFDLQQVQPLPKSSIGDAFYLRQLSLYTMCVTAYDTKNPTFYQWSEDQAGRGSVCVSSALLHHLENTVLEDVETLRLFCDGCGGQNKNQHLLHSLMFWLVHKAPSSLKRIQLVFPVRGHSFLPADRVFARIEKDLRKVAIITKKEQYCEMYSKHGNVRTLGEDWNLYDVKKLSQYLKPINGIQNMKRIYFKRSQNHRQCLLKTFDNFVFEGAECYISYLKKGRTFPATLESIALGNKISSEKKRDITNLLVKQFGEAWRDFEDLDFFKTLLDEERPTLGIEQFQADPQIEICDCCEEDCGLRL